MDFDAKQVEINEKYKEVAEKAKAFNEALKEFRAIEVPEITLNTETEERNKIIAIGNEINGRTAFVLRALLVQHGNLLFM